MAVEKFPLILAPSLLAANHARLAEEAERLVQWGIKWAHYDVMDGHFVPNMSFDPKTLEDLKKEVPDLFYDVHLMLDEPHKYIEAFHAAGADHISIHIEPEIDHQATLSAIRALGITCGITINPDTPVKSIEAYLGEVDMVLVMTVQPGFGGQGFRMDVLPKIEELNRIRTEKAYKFRLEVDGGINLETGKLVKEKGVDTLVAGSAFFKAEDKAAFAKSIES